MKISDYTKANRDAWNEVMPKHQAAFQKTLDNWFSTPGFIFQYSKELLEIFNNLPISGKDVIHLCCNNGIELLSIKNMGATRCVGIDISEIAINDAVNRAKKFNIKCEFVCSDVFNISEKFYNSFDVVHTTSGCIGWIPDIYQFFNICNKLLQVNGVIIIHEIHPFSETLPFDNVQIDNRLQIIEPYFRSEPIIENDSLDYIGKSEYYAKTHYWFVHKISDIVKGLNQNNFIIDEFIESPQDISMGHGKIETLQAGVPLSMIIVGKKI